ncbi:hypothetical protein BDK51DRAFT_51034 [Blyttiomyces helicus]|uniref:Uncharacterized protein n=1 Tax=Blyttiomyces helicus TaxID=388810 RepID=A0A4V1IQH4_9FUNG|nr:hypothetical protein BDK51DRAFT_51034 [Blyttiomyces helicus]|eukprot:RKO86567.1 hypothetical protein BDK51DRAFT_51034 [Blyttiomyces helicus]
MDTIVDILLRKKVELKHRGLLGLFPRKKNTATAFSEAETGGRRRRARLGFTPSFVGLSATGLVDSWRTEEDQDLFPHPDMRKQPDSVPKTLVPHDLMAARPPIPIPDDFEPKIGGGEPFQFPAILAILAIHLHFYAIPASILPPLSASSGSGEGLSGPFECLRRELKNMDFMALRIRPNAFYALDEMDGRSAPGPLKYGENDPK